MQVLDFEFCGHKRQLTLPDGALSRYCAAEIIEGKCYPWPVGENPRCVVDLGACAGEFTTCAALLWPEATIYAFEPYPPSYELLNANCEGLECVVTYPFAVGVQDGKAKLHLSTLGAVGHSLMVRDSATGESVDVDVVSAKFVDNLMPDVLKIDVEGLEHEILAAMDLQHIHRIYVEFHREIDRKKIMELLDETHHLWWARIDQISQGELAYVRKF